MLLIYHCHRQRAVLPKKRGKLYFSKLQGNLAQKIKKQSEGPNWFGLWRINRILGLKKQKKTKQKLMDPIITVGK